MVGVKTFSTKQNPELYFLSWCFSDVPLHFKLKHTNVLYISVKFDAIFSAEPLHTQ